MNRKTGRTTTTTGRVVYERPKHIMTEEDRMRIAGKSIQKYVAEQNYNVLIRQISNYIVRQSKRAHQLNPKVNVINEPYIWVDQEIINQLDKMTAAVLQSNGDPILYGSIMAL